MPEYTTDDAADALVWHARGSALIDLVTPPSGTEGATLKITTKNGATTYADNLCLKDGKVGIGTSSPSAPLEVTSSSGGVIMPRMTTAQRNAISSPTNGEMVYDTDLNKFYGRANSSWVALH